jgi:AraC-like DNA-binding protein
MAERRRKPKERSGVGISNAVVSPVLASLKELGFDAEREISGLEERPAPVVPGEIADHLLNLASERLGDDALGVHLAQRIPIGGLGLLDYALCTSSTLRDALGRVATHYKVLTERVRLRLVEDPARATLIFDRLSPTGHSRHWMEFSFAILASRIRQTLAEAVAFDEVCFRHVAPESTQVHDAFFGSRVLFEQDGDRLAFPRELLDSPLRTALVSLAELLDARIRQLAPMGSPDALLDRVRQVVVALLDERDSHLSSAAMRLHMPRRTLQRELHRRGTSHQEILDEVRRERALALLGEACTVAEVAARLAYSESSAFFRAFRRWTGASPRATRRRPISSDPSSSR